MNWRKHNECRTGAIKVGNQWRIDRGRLIGWIETEAAVPLQKGAGAA
jgi:hypothetical protein